LWALRNDVDGSLVSGRNLFPFERRFDFVLAADSFFGGEDLAKLYPRELQRARGVECLFIGPSYIIRHVLAYNYWK
jgi:hypothetical protein